MDKLIGVKYMVMEKIYQSSVFFFEIMKVQEQGLLTTIKLKNDHTIVRYCDELIDVAYDVNLERYLTDSEIKEML